MSVDYKKLWIFLIEKNIFCLQHIVLIDGAKLTELLIENRFGVSTNEIKAIDMDALNDCARIDFGI